MSTHPHNDDEFVVSSGNVFADIGLDNADEELAKAALALAISRRIRAKELSQTAAAAVLRTDQAKVSLLMNGKVGGFTFDRLVRFLNALEVDVQISLAPRPDQQRGKTEVLSA